MFDEKTWQNAMVIYASNSNNPRPGDAFSYSQVQSRLLLWCESGKGLVKINNVPIEMTPGKVVFTPWNHSITRIVDKNEPYLLGSIHIIPSIPHETPPRYSPFHEAATEFPEFFDRHDEKLEGFEDTVSFTVPLDHPLLNLARYVIDRYSSECPEFILRTFPRQLLYELYMLKAGEEKCCPSPLQNMLHVIEHYLEDRITMGMLKYASNLSQPTIYRIFKKFLDCTPREYIARRRMERAAELLRSTNLPIGVIARRLQYDTPFYFSKCFKQYFQLSPGKWRNSRMPMPIPRPCREASSQRDVHGRKHWLYIPDSKK